MAGSAEYSYYDILSITAKATLDDIRLAYREQARYYHPDVTDLDLQVAAAKLKIVNEAYETLKDPEKKRTYDLRLMAQRESKLWTYLPGILDQLKNDRGKAAFEELRELQTLAPDSDLVRGLIATTLHIQAGMAFEATKFQTARKFIGQALAVNFADEDFRNQLLADLALIDQRFKTGGSTGVAALFTQLSTHDPVVVLRALQQAEGLDYSEESAKLSPEFWKLAADSPFREVRAAAVKSLLVHLPGFQEGLRLLHDLYTLTKKTRTLTLQLEQDKAVLLKRLGKKDYAQIAPLLCALIWEGTEPFRRGVIDAIGEMGHAPATIRLLPLLFSAFPSIRGGAALATDKIEGNFGVADRLRGMVGLESEDGRAKRKLTELRSKTKKKDLIAAENLCLFWEQPARRGDVIRTWLAEGRAGNPLTEDSPDPSNDLISFLLVSLVDKRGGVHEVARDAFVKIGSSAVAPLCSVLRDDDWLIRKLAAEILGEIRDAGSVDALILALEDAKPLVAKAAAWALGEIRDAKATYPLLNLLKNEDPMVSDAAQAALNRIRGQTNRL